MGLLDKTLKKTIGNAVESGVKKAVNKAAANAAANVAGTVASNFANKAANKVTAAANAKFGSTAPTAGGSAAQAGAAAGAAAGTAAAEARKAFAEANAAFAQIDAAQMNQAFSILEGMANSAAANTKVCESCGQPAAADKKFCPNCGAPLPELTLAQGAVCPACGKQNDIGTRFCADCGAKLPAAAAEEAAEAARDAEVLQRWPEALPQFPVWNGGGRAFELEVVNNVYDGGRSAELARFSGMAAHRSAALGTYCEALKSEGFRNPYGDGRGWDETLMKIIDGHAYCFNQSEMEGESGGEDSFTVSFFIDDSKLPKKEEPKKKGGLLGALLG